MKKLILAGLMILSLSSCGYPGRIPQETAIATHTPSPIMENRSSASTVIPSVPVENMATVVLAKGLAPDQFKKYIGLNYPPLPEGLSQTFGLVIWGSNDYSLAKISDGEHNMLWLQNLISRDANGKPAWEVKDILELPKVEDDVVLVPDECLLNGKPNSEIIVIGSWDDEVFSTRHMTNEKILFAWRANTELGIFEVIPTDGIECFTDNAASLN